MYLSLRCTNVDQEDNNGRTVFIMYMLKEDILRCKQLLMRGADINFGNKEGKTPLHLAVENKVSEKVIKFLLNAGARPHIEDVEGKDCCDKAIESNSFKRIDVFWSMACRDTPALRVKYTEQDEQKEVELKLKEKYK
jgi:ankyrin repeat protein